MIRESKIPEGRKTPLDPALAELIDRRAGLSEATKAAVMALVQTNRRGRRVKTIRLPRGDPRPPDIGPALWREFAARLGSARMTDRQRRFVTEYLNCLTGAKAARRAGYSSNRARQQAYDNRRKPKIRRLIKRGFYLQVRDCYVRAGRMRPDARRIPRNLRYKT